MKKVLYILFVSAIIIFSGSITFLLSSFLIGFVMKSFVIGESVLSAEGILLAQIALFGGLLVSPFSLIPSYKLSLKLAKAFQSRGWEIKNPKQLFWVSVGLLFLPIILLVLLGLLQ